MKNQNLLIALGIGAIAYFAYQSMQKKKKKQLEGGDSEGTNTALPTGKTWIQLAKENPEIEQKVRALQVGLNVVLTQLGKPNIGVDGDLGTETQQAIMDVFGDHYGTLKAGDIATLDWFLRLQASINAQKKDDSRFLSNKWFQDLWK
jgi:hypothetical protein